MKQFLASLTLAVACAVSSRTALPAAEPDPREAAIHKTAEAFVEAFQNGDAKALAALWTTDGDYVDENGRILTGRKAIEDSFAELFAGNKGLKLHIDVASLRFPSADSAIEDGTTAVIAPDGTAPSRARYTNLFVKKDGQWLLSSVRESADPGPSQYQYLRPLEWTIGEWVDDVPGGAVGHLSFAWAPGHNFIIATRTVDYVDTSVIQSTQWIGWDAAAQQIRSWSFQADGGFGSSTWTKTGANWVVKSESVLADGSKVTSTNTVGSVDAGTLSWRSQDQKVNGKPLPDTQEVKMKRVQ